MWICIKGIVVSIFIVDMVLGIWQHKILWHNVQSWWLLISTCYFIWYENESHDYIPNYIILILKTHFGLTIPTTSYLLSLDFGLSKRPRSNFNFSKWLGLGKVSAPPPCFQTYKISKDRKLAHNMKLNIINLNLWWQ
jgi:hypothetical protein